MQQTLENHFSPLDEEIQFATKKIKELYLKDDKSKKFIQHLIGAFIPINQMNKVYTNHEKMYDAVTGLQCAPIKEISESLSEYSVAKMFIDAKVNVEGRKEYSAEEFAELTQKLNAIPDMCKKHRFAYTAEESDKYISGATAMALIDFASDMILFGDKVIERILLTKRQEHENRMRKAGEYNENLPKKMMPPKPVAASLKDCVDDNAFEKLLKLKSKMEEDEQSRETL